MGRVALTDGSGLWFDPGKAVLFEEKTWWDGHNHISTPTGSQWDHEWLYLTKGERWILHSHSQRQCVRETYVILSHEEAADWLLQNGHDTEEQLNKLPQAVRLSVKDLFDSKEI